MDGFLGSAEHQNYFLYGSAAYVFDGSAQYCALTQAEQLFCFSHAGGFACSQNDGCQPPGFPVEPVGVDELHAAFLTESRTRGPVWSLVQEIRVCKL